MTEAFDSQPATKRDIADVREDLAGMREDLTSVRENVDRLIPTVANLQVASDDARTRDANADQKLDRLLTSVDKLTTLMTKETQQRHSTNAQVTRRVSVIEQHLGIASESGA